MSGHIISIGGGGFSENQQDLRFEIYGLSLCATKTPKACFLPTASADSEEYTARYYTAFKQLNCHPTHLHLFRPHLADIADYLMSQSLIYVGGGNTKNMLAIWRDWGLDKILAEFWSRGGVLMGVSAGAICWFEQALTDSYHGAFRLIPGLGFLPGACSPHFDSEAGREQTFIAELQKINLRTTSYGIEDNVALHFHGKSLIKTLGTQPGKKAVRFSGRPENLQPILL